ncbi:MAG: N-acetyl sugar amidotransferase [Patescibacteria group bacterium]
MIYCKKCVQPDNRPGIYFNKEGVCGACLYQEDVEKKINWNKREEELKRIAEWAKKTAKKNNVSYNCIVGISGGKDSTFQALYSRDKLGLKPLLVNCEPEGITEIGKKNIENLKNLGFDTISIRPNPKVLKKLMKKDFYEFLNPVKVTEFPLFASSYIVADQFNIPLVIQGENPALTLGVRKTGYGVNEDALNTNKSDTLGTGWKRYIGDGVTEKDLFWYHYDEKGIRTKGIKAIWLQYYVKEWSQPHNANFSIKHGLIIRRNFNPNDIGTYVGYSQLDSDAVQLNQMLKFIKFGFGQCTDHACYDIREGLITKKKGIELVKKYDGKCHKKYIKKFCDYIGISLTEFYKVADTFRDTKIWWIKDGQWWKNNIKGGPSTHGKVYLSKKEQVKYKKHG